MIESQEPKYDVTALGRLMNRETGQIIPDDEPVFIFRARDCHAATILATYANMLVVQAHRQAVLERVQDFTDFANMHPDRMHEPGSGDSPKALGKGLGALLPVVSGAKPLPKPKVIQVTSTPSHLVALKDDGTVWVRSLNNLDGTFLWTKLPDPRE